MSSDVHHVKGGRSQDFTLQGPVMSPDSFRRLAHIAMREAGLAIADNKSDMVRTRLARRLRHLGLSSYEGYCDLVERPEGADELGQLISALTTNVSHFFRESHHFDLLATDVAKDLLERAGAGQPTRIWSAGCANGQEPYTIAMVLNGVGLGPENGCKILATDIDPDVISFARTGAYPKQMLGGLSDEHLSRYFHADGSGTFEAKGTLRDAVTFRVLNLLKPWPMTGRFDAVFCRNVVIYFDKDTQSRLWSKFAERIRPGGWLFLGHSERISPCAEAYFAKSSVTAYRRTDVPITVTGKES